MKIKGIVIGIFFCLLFIVKANATINQIRWGSSAGPFTGLTVTWSNNGTADSIRWGYTTAFEQGIFSGTRRNGYASGIYFFKYQFPVVTANTTLYYQLFNSSAQTWTAQKTFHTAPDTASAIYSFAALGDCRDYPTTLTTISNLVTARAPALTLFNGDLTVSGNSTSQYNTFFSAATNFLENNLVYHAEGNHDAGSTSLFSNLWDLPQTNGTNLYYAVRYGNTIFITINTTTPTNAAQLSWLQTTLANAAADPTIVWKVVSLHHAFFTIGNHSGDMNAYRTTLWKAFDDYGVDLVFTGHDHNYQRSKPVNLNVSSTAPVAQYGSNTGQGRCQIVSGGAGAGLYTQGSSADAWAVNLFNSTYNYVFCDVNNCRITIRAYNQNNAVIDSVVLDKTGSAACTATGLSEPVQKFNPIHVFPNPAEHSFNLHYSSELTGEVTIRIVDSQGKEVGSKKVFKSEKDMEIRYDMSKHAKGIYNVSVLMGNQRDDAVLILAK
ncbi:MAG: metallophosphoesterase [Bacteroidetes bacterium]|nr:metallophosphoesterase [Bacteroidota bacterium]